MSKLILIQGQVLWDRTLEFVGGVSGSSYLSESNVEITAIDIDNNDDIYICGNIKYDLFGFNIAPVDGFIVKYTAEGNLLWQSQSEHNGGSAVYYEDITVDDTTKKPTTFGRVRYALGDEANLITRYDSDGSLSWRREIDEGNSFAPRHQSVDGDQSFIYLLFADPSDTETYVYGKVSATGNGLGDFEYDDGTGAPLLQYITSSGSNGTDIGEKISTLSDGSVRNNISDFKTYPFNANKILFDDLATHVSNKRRQMDSADSFEYSGSPAIRINDFQEMNLLGDNIFEGSDFFPDNPSWTIFNSGNGDTITGSGTSGDPYIVTRQSGSTYAQVGVLLPTVTGKSYEFKCVVGSGTGNGSVFRAAEEVWMTNGQQISNLIQSVGGSNTTLSVRFIATGTQTALGLSVNDPGNASFHSVEAKEIAWTDQSGKGNDGAIAGATHNAAGYWDFDGVNDGITIPYTPNLAFTDAIFSLEAWIYIDDLSNSRFPIINKREAQTIDSTNRPYVFEVNSVGRLKLSLDFPDGGPYTTQIQTDTGVIVTGQWYHVATAHDGTTAKLFINGFEWVSVASGTTSLENTGDVPTRIGYRNTASGTETGDGRIGEVRIYPRPLTAAQVYQNYNASKQKYINELAFSGVKIGPGIVYDSNLLLNYNFGNRYTYDGLIENIQNRYSSSQEFGSDFWGLYELNVEANAAIAPDGTQSADRLYTTTSNTAHQIKPNIPVELETYTVSVYLKTAGDRYFSIRGDNQSNYVTYDLVDGTISNDSTANSTSSFMIDEGDGWYRCGMSYLPATTGNDPEFFLVDTGAYAGNALTGSGTGGVYIWGAQLEKGSSPREYLRTVLSPLTPPTTVKNLSSSSNTGTVNGAIFNSAGYFEFDGTNDSITVDAVLTQGTELSMEAWFNTNTLSSTQYIVDQSVPDGLQSGAMIRILSTGQQISSFFYYDAGFGLSVDSTAISVNTWHHVVVTISASDNALRMYIDGALEDEDTSVTFSTIRTPPAGSTFAIGSEYDLSEQFFDGEIGQVRIYQQSLSATEVLQNFNATRTKYGV